MNFIGPATDYLGMLKEVKNIKKTLNGMLKTLNKYQTVAKNIETLTKTFNIPIESWYRDESGNMYCSFNVKNISSKFIISGKTGKCRLSKHCTVFIPGTGRCIENYRW